MEHSALFLNFAQTLSSVDICNGMSAPVSSNEAVLHETRQSLICSRSYCLISHLRDSFVCFHGVDPLTKSSGSLGSFLCSFRCESRIGHVFLADFRHRFRRDVVLVVPFGFFRGRGLNVPGSPAFIVRRRLGTLLALHSVDISHDHVHCRRIMPVAGSAPVKRVSYSFSTNLCRHVTLTSTCLRVRQDSLRAGFAITPVICNRARSATTFATVVARNSASFRVLLPFLRVESGVTHVADRDGEKHRAYDAVPEASNGNRPLFQAPVQTSLFLGDGVAVLNGTRQFFSLSMA